MLNFILSKNYKKESEIIKIPEIAFYESLYTEISDSEDIHQYIKGCVNCREPFTQTKKLILKLARNYEYYKKHLQDPSSFKFCKYLIYWMHTEKLKFPANSLLLNQWKNCIPCVWKNLEENNNIRKGTCNFDNDEISYSFIQVMKLLHKICLIRGNAEVLKSITSDREKCMQFNEKLKRDLKNIILQFSSTSGEPKLRKSYIEIYDKCTLKDVKTLFEEIKCPPEETKTCPEPKPCDTAPPCTKQECTKDSCSNLKELCNQIHPPQACQCEEKVIQQECKEPTLEILERLCPKVCTETLHYISPANKEQQEKSDKNPLLQVPVTVLSSVVGTIFFFLLLYKV
ncbi:hypothetical protein PVIIG_04613 [Plasmodium vivax India VII]|uniref:VIR protein n=1 Tax=Plasmodium vivax India VII TaxID=1077284 RepID=A0A0J9SLQ6_PLAVI|nr:hypothetical protein PVIIG_04613 [Plasmodium vivax India VII]